MDWANERYVRLYTRDSADMVAVGWEGRTVLFELLRKVDRSGVLDHGGEMEIVADILRIPQDLFLTGFARLLKRGVVQATETRIVLPNFMKAQDSAQTDAARKRAERERRRAETLESVTNGHAVSHAVTSSHSEPIRAEPCLTDPPKVPQGTSAVSEFSFAEGTDAGQKKARPRKPPASEPTEAEWPAIEKVLARLSAEAGVRYESRRAGKPTNSALIVLRRLREGHPEDELRMVARHRGIEWGDKPEMRKYLTAETVFGRQKFDTYLAQARAAVESPPSRAGPSANEPVSPVVQDILRGQR